MSLMNEPSPKEIIATKESLRDLEEGDIFILRMTLDHIYWGEFVVLVEDMYFSPNSMQISIIEILSSHDGDLEAWNSEILEVEFLDDGYVNNEMITFIKSSSYKREDKEHIKNDLEYNYPEYFVVFAFINIIIFSFTGIPVII